MQLPSIALAGLVSLARRAAGAPDYFHYPLTYYPRDDVRCAAARALTLDLQQTYECYNLTHGGAKAFTTGGDPTKQIPAGCTVAGYVQFGCTGTSNLAIAGPTRARTCVVVTKPQHALRQPARSVMMMCAPEAEPSYAPSPVPTPTTTASV